MVKSWLDLGFSSLGRSNSADVMGNFSDTPPLYCAPSMTQPLPPFEPYLVKTVEPIRLTTPEERRRFLHEADFNSKKGTERTLRVFI